MKRKQKIIFLSHRERARADNTERLTTYRNMTQNRHAVNLPETNRRRREKIAPFTLNSIVECVLSK